MQFLKRMNDIVSPWELFLLACISYALFDVPLEVAFNHFPTKLELALDLLISVAFLIDAYRHQRRVPFVKNTIWSRVLQVGSCLPFETMFYALTEGHAGWVLYSQLTKVLILPHLISTVAERSRNHIVPKRFKFLIAMTITVLSLNALACGWLVIYPPEEDLLTEYNKAMYWLVTTVATVGYGDITPSTNVGRAYTMVVMILGATVWGILIASASRMMLASDLRKQQRKEKMEALHSFFSHYEVPKPVQREVISFFNHQWARKVSEYEQAILNDLPPALQQEIQVFLNLRPISRVSLFRGASKECLADVAGRLEQVFFSPGQRVIKKDDVGEEMFLIGHGTMNVHVGEQFITALGPGACFGEMALIGDAKRATDVTAASYCDVFKLTKKQFDELIARHADLKANVLRIAAERQAKLQEDSAPRNSSDKAS